MRLFPETELQLSGVARAVLAAGGCEPAKDVDKEQLAIGLAVELEHFPNDPKAAENVALDHLAETPDYYTKPMKKDWGADEAKERIEDMAKKAQIENNDNPFAWKSRTNRDMSSNTLGGIANEIDFQLGRPTEPPDESRVRDMALAYANIAVEKSPHRDHGDGSQKMRIATVDAITKAYFDERNTRRKWNVNLKLTGTPSWETSKTASSASQVFVTDGNNEVACPSCSHLMNWMVSPASGDGPWVKRCNQCSHEMVARRNMQTPQTRVAQSKTLKDCSRCKGKGYYSGYIGRGSQPQFHAAIPCDQPGCVNGKYDPSSLCQECHDHDGRELSIEEIGGRSKMAQMWRNNPNSLQSQASVFILEDDPKRIEIFKSAFGEGNIVVTSNVKTAIDLLRTQSFDRVFLDRDLSSLNENGEDVAWQMEREKLAASTPVVIHSENTRGQRVMARYLRKYHSNVSVVPFRELRKSLEVPGGVKL